MITIGDILRPKHIDLRLPSADAGESIFRVASLLRNDSRIKDWNAFYSGLMSREPCVAAAHGCELHFPHTRTPAVNSMVMSAGKPAEGLANSARYIFVIGVPPVMAADHLRVIGALARVFRDANAVEELRKAALPENFLSILIEREVRL